MGEDKMKGSQNWGNTNDLETLYEQLARCNISAGWAKPTPSLYPEPYQTFLPHKWSWKDSRAALVVAGRLISTDLAERRNLILYNPTEGNSYSTVRTLITAYQMILPGEQARSHRHTPNALRFILEGEGSYTIVDGQRLDMHPNDVLLTPNWSWHGHASEASEACYWIDCLDVPLVHFLEPMFFEQHPAVYEPVETVPTDSPFLFSWENVQKALENVEQDQKGSYGKRVELGSPALKSIGLHMHRLEGGTKTNEIKTTANQIFCVVEGYGTTFIDGHKFSWGRGDVVAIPGWHPYSHHIKQDATLFEMSDEPIMQALGWLRHSVGS